MAEEEGRRPTDQKVEVGPAGGDQVDRELIRLARHHLPTRGHTRVCVRGEEHRSDPTAPLLVSIDVEWDDGTYAYQFP